mgnify:FL=1
MAGQHKTTAGKLLGVKAGDAYLGRSEAEFRNLVLDGKIPPEATKLIGGKAFFLRKELDKLKSWTS